MRVQQLFASVVFLAMVGAAATTQARTLPSRFDGILDGIQEALSHLDRCGRGIAGEPLDRCLESDLARVMEDTTREYGGAEYRLNQYLTVEVRPAKDLRIPGGRRSSGGLGTRILDFFDALRFRYRPEDVDNVLEGRKKKKGGKKHKMGMMMAAASMGMTVIGGMAMKMMMGGVMMIAMKALILAKIALLLSAIMAIKKLIQGSGGGGSIQSTWGGGGGGGGGGNEHGGYRRSYGLADDVPSMPVADTMAYKDQLSSYNNNAQYTH